MNGTVGNQPALRRQVRDIVLRLDDAYGRKTWVPYHGPLEELVQTILSQHTSDVNSERAYLELRRRFSTWEAVRDAPVDDVVDAIRSGGLAEQKARRIQQVLATVLDCDPDEPLSCLNSLPLDEAKAYLTSLPGVGPKTAACVLLFACGRPALPVDTHVYRVSKRLGLIDERVTEQQAHDRLESLLDAEDVYTFHVNMIAHGRAVCTARNPRCATCPLSDLCRYYRDMTQGSGVPGASLSGTNRSSESREQR